MSRRKGRSVQSDEYAFNSYDAYSTKKVKQDNTINFSTYAKQKRAVHLTAKTENQQEYIYQLTDPSISIVLGIGPAGTGKTYLSTLYAIKELRENKIDKIVITRPAVSTDEDHGFLPGTLLEKMAPWVTPIIDVFKEYYSVQEVNKMLENEVIEVSPLAYMRGRTFKNSVIIGDEFQNATPNQTKMLMSRIGFGSKIIITGDIEQHDRGFENNGLKDFMERIMHKQVHGISAVKFSNEDISRHPIIETVLDLYKD